MTAGIVAWCDQLHACVLFHGRYQHFTFFRAPDAPSQITDWLHEYGIREAIVTTPDADAERVGCLLLDRGLNVYALPLHVCFDIAAAASTRPLPRTLALVATRAFFLPRWRSLLTPLR